MKRHALAASLLLAALPVSAALGGEALTGKAVVLDGDTIRVHGSVVGLYGIAAPGLGQICQTRSGANVTCGQDAARALAERIGTASIACEPRGTDRHGRAVALCRVGGEDIAAWMVGHGHAVADRLRASDYVAEGTKAWAKRLGLWAGVFDDPTELPHEVHSGTLTVSVLGR